jgi:hypothetical protein
MRHLLPLVLFLTAGSPMPGQSIPPRPPAAVPSVAEQVVQTQVEAFNRRDIDAFLATYAPDLKMYLHPSQKLMMSGLDEARQTYAAQFASMAKVPSIRVDIPTRIVQGNFVIDHEVFTGAPDGKELRVVAIYEVREGKIQNVWFIE